MIVISFAAESMSGALMLSGSAGARSERAEVQQQSPASQAEFRMALVPVHPDYSRCCDGLLVVGVLRLWIGWW